MSGDDPERARREAAHWYAELQDEASGREVWQRFMVWERRPENAAAFREIEAALSTLDRVRFSRPAASKASARWPMAAGLAAACLLAVFGVSRLIGEDAVEPPDVIALVYATKIGAQESVVLADGSQAILNTASRIEVAYTDRERRITLLEGQALFDVQREPRPFIVVAGGAETRAIGTRFEVYLPPEGLQVTLLEGLVSIGSEAAGKEVILSPGDQMTLRDGDMSVTRIDPSRTLSWRSGMVPFADVTLAEAALELNRYSEVKLRVDAALAGERLSGSFKAGDQDAFVAVLEAFLPVRAERRDGDIIILPAE